MTDFSESTINTLHELRKSLHFQLHKSIKKFEKQKEELNEAQKYLWYKQIGDSLLAISGSQNHRGLSKIMLKNVYTLKDETVAINPKLDLKENAALIFKKAKKGKRGSEISLKKVEATEKEVMELSDLKRECDEAIISENVSCHLLIEKIQHSLSKLTSRMLIPSEKNSSQTEKVPYRHYKIDKWDVYIGKNDSQNDDLSVHFAKPSDIWLHVAGHAGSHVVIRRQKKEESPPVDVLEKCAAMAVWFSKAKHTSYSEVHYTEARFVRKRRHAPPGEVIIDRCKSIRVSPKSPHDLFPSTFLNND